MIENVIMHTDGGARGNPGPAAVGIVIYDGSHHNILWQKGEYIGHTTNNQAEYKALLMGLRQALMLGVQNVDCRLDSELVVRQMQGKYKVREEGLAPMATEILGLTSKFKNVSFTHVPREKNKPADKLVNEALDNSGY